MGECMFYLKASFKTNKEAKKAAKEINAFLKQNNKANENFSNEPSKGFEKVKEYIKIIEGTWKNDIQWYGYDPDCKWIVYAHDNIILYQASVGHLGSWDNLQTYIEKKFKPIRVRWSNEESGCGSLESLELYDSVDIVLKILERKDTLPLLMGIHPDLDELISLKLKE